MGRFFWEEKDAKEKLLWLLGFLNVPDLQDQERVRTGDFINILDDFKKFIFPVIIEDSGDFSYSREFMCSVQEYLKGLVQTIINAPETDGVTWLGNRYSLKFRPALGSNKIIRFRAIKISMENEKDQVIPNENFSAILEDSFYETLSHFPINRLKMCKKPDCGKFFFQKTKRPADYCSLSHIKWGKDHKYTENHREEINKKRRKKKEIIQIVCPQCSYSENLEGNLEEIKHNPSLDKEYCPQCRHDVLIHKELILEGKKWLSANEWGKSEWSDELERRD